MSERDADLLETQLFAALEREQALIAWAREALPVIRSRAEIAEEEGFGPFAALLRDLADACPLPDEDPAS